LITAPQPHLIVAILLTALLAPGLTACGRRPPPPPPNHHAPIIPPTGFIFSHFRAPLILPGELDLGDLERRPSRREIYFRIPTPYVPTDLAFGRADIEDAARAAGITRLIWADYEFTSVLVYFKTMKVHAYGYTDEPEEDPASPVKISAP
jgi:hypothetical protein